MSNHLNVPNV